jgi:hypothetical protein
VANVYVGVYDSILVVLSALLTADVLYRPGTGGPPFRSRTFPALLFLLYAGPWFSQHLARFAGVQPDSLILLAFAGYQLVVARELTAAPAPGGDGDRLSARETTPTPGDTGPPGRMAPHGP